MPRPPAHPALPPADILCRWVDTTLAWKWYRFTGGNTHLAELCRHLPQHPYQLILRASCLAQSSIRERKWLYHAVLRADFSRLPECPTLAELSQLALAIEGDSVIRVLTKTPTDRPPYEENLERFVSGWFNPRARASLDRPTPWTGTVLQLWSGLFLCQRNFWRHGFTASTAEATCQCLDAPYDTDRNARDLWPALRAALMSSPAQPHEVHTLEHPTFVPAVKDFDPLRIDVTRALTPETRDYLWRVVRVISEEAWGHGLVRLEQFGYRPKPELVPASVRLRPGATAKSTYSGKGIPTENARVVIAAAPDGGDGVSDTVPYIIDGKTRFRVPFRFEKPLTQFDYQRALKSGLFTPDTGGQFVRDSGCFDFQELPPVTRDEARECYLAHMLSKLGP